MEILIGIYILSVLLAVVTGTIDYKETFGRVTVGDICFIAGMSLIPVGNIGVMLAASTGIIGRKYSYFFDQEVF